MVVVVIIFGGKFLIKVNYNVDFYLNLLIKGCDRTKY